MGNPINYPDSQGPLAENYVADEELMSADILIGQEVVYKNLLSMVTALVGVQETGSDYVAHGLQLVWSSSMTCLLRAGTALSTQGYYYNGTGAWAFVANTGASGNTFAVFNPSDQNVSFSSYVSSSGPVLCTVEVAPALVQNALLSRNIYDPGTGGVTPQNVYTRYNFGLTVDVLASAPNASQAPAATAGYIKIAEVTVPANATTLTQSNIVDWQRSSQWTNGATSTVWSGNLRTRTMRISSTYALPVSDFPIVVRATGGAAGINVTLPPLGQIPDLPITISKVDSAAGAVTVAGNGSDLIDGLSSWSLTQQYQSITVQAEHAGWIAATIPISTTAEGYTVVQRDSAGGINVVDLSATGSTNVVDLSASGSAAVAGAIAADGGVTAPSGQNFTVGSTNVLPHGKQVFTSSGTFTVPDNITTLYISGCAAGGNGATGVTGTTFGGGGGGGGGEWAIYEPFSVTPLSSLTVTIGSHGSITSIGSFVLHPGGDGSNATSTQGSGGGSGGSGGNGHPGGAGGSARQETGAAIGPGFPGAPGFQKGGEAGYVLPTDPSGSSGGDGVAQGGGGGGSYAAGGTGASGVQLGAVEMASASPSYGGGGGGGFGWLSGYGGNTNGGPAILIVEW